MYGQRVEITSCEFITTILYKNLEDQVPHSCILFFSYQLCYNPFAGQSHYSCFAVLSYKPGFNHKLHKKTLEESSQQRRKGRMCTQNRSRHGLPSHPCMWSKRVCHVTNPCHFVVPTDFLLRITRQKSLNTTLATKVSTKIPKVVKHRCEKAV